MTSTIILLSTLIVGCFLILRHPSKKWCTLGIGLILVSIICLLASYLLEKVPLDIFLICTFLGGFSFVLILYTSLLSKIRQKRFPNEPTEMLLEAEESVPY